jgi:hypothetical protein
MKAAALLMLLLWQTAPGNEPPVARPDAMRYERAIRVQPGVGQTCAVLDAGIFPHAAPSLSDLRIFPSQPASGGTAHEVPYAITLSEAVTEETQPARVLNLGVGSGSHTIVFDLEMPARAYTGVTLDLDPAMHDFLATATVSGSDTPGGKAKSTALGSFTLFDLSAQHLSRDTTLPLAESTFRYLHVALNISDAPGGGPAMAGRFVPAMMRGAEVPPSREAQILYTTVAETTSITTSGRESRASFVVPPRVPIERVSFQMAPGFKGNFSRDVRVTAQAAAAEKSSAGPVEDQDGRAPMPETVSGNILRVHATEAGREIRSEQLGIPAILGANLQREAKVDVVIENGDDQPLPIGSVRLEMRQRKLCFEAPAVGADSGLEMFYGDPRLVAPVYDYDRLFAAAEKPLVAELGQEMLNPNYRAPVEMRSFTERHPEVLWIALIAVICALGMVALRSSRNVGA